MTIRFPSIKPSSLAFTPAKYEVSKPEFRDIVVSPRLLASKPNSPTLSLTFSNIDADKILSIFTAWESSYSGFYELTLPSVITSSISSTNFATRMGSPELFTWRFTSEPTLSNISAGVGDVSVQLEGQLFGDVKGPSAWAQQLSTAAGVTYNYEREQILTDSQGNLYHVILVSVNNVNSFKATKFTKNGSLMWSKHYNKTTGFGNGASIAYNYSWTAKVGPQGLVIVAGQASNVYSANSNLSSCNKVICINTGSGLVRWAKAVTASDNYGHLFASVHVNDKTGHTYIFSQRTGFNYPGGFSIVTLDPYGEVTAGITADFYACNTLTTNGGISLTDGSMVLAGNYNRPGPGGPYYGPAYSGAFYIILNASGTVKQSVQILGETLDQNTAFTFQYHPLATVLSNQNILWTGTKGVIEFNSDMSSVVSYQGLGNVIDISERPDGSFAVLSQQIIPLGPVPSRHPSGWCVASLKILNSSRSQVTAMKEIFLGSNPYLNTLMDGAINKLDRYVFIPANSKTLISINPTIDSWETQIEPLTYSAGSLTVRTLTTGLPINISSLTTPTITNPNFSYSTTGTISNDYTGSVTVDNPTDSWTFYSSMT